MHSRQLGGGDDRAESGRNAGDDGRKLSRCSAAALHDIFLAEL